jgi:hypothetical protein
MKILAHAKKLFTKMGARIKNHICKYVPKSSLEHIVRLTFGPRETTLAQKMSAHVKNHLCKDVPKHSLVHICQVSRGADTLAQNGN